MFLTDFAAEVGTGEAAQRLALFAVATLPLIAFVIRATADDVTRFRAAFLRKEADEGER